jgi:hypothetical protein
MQTARKTIVISTIKSGDRTAGLRATKVRKIASVMGAMSDQIGKIKTTKASASFVLGGL